MPKLKAIGKTEMIKQIIKDMKYCMNLAAEACELSRRAWDQVRYAAENIERGRYDKAAKQLKWAENNLSPCDGMIADIHGTAQEAWSIAEQLPTEAPAS